jgi:urea carboxylase
MAVEVVKPGLETAVQDYPGRLGHLSAGFPPSGPMDHWSFRLANLLVGNPAGAAALECQFVGPSLLFRAPCVVAVTGADLAPTLDAAPVELWQSFEVAAGQTLSLEALISPPSWAPSPHSAKPAWAATTATRSPPAMC